MNYQTALEIYATADGESELTEQQKAALDFIIETANLKPISLRQAKQQLLLLGKLDAVQVAIDAVDDPVIKQSVQIYWDNSQNFERRHPMIVQIAQMIGLTDAELNQAFKDAAKL